MLRRKLLIALGSLVTLVAVLTIAAISFLQGLLNELERTTTTASQGLTLIDELSADVSALESRLHSIVPGRAQRFDDLPGAVSHFNRLLEDVAAGPAMWTTDSRAEGLFQSISRRLPDLGAHIEQLTQASAGDERNARLQEALALSVAVQADVLDLGREVRLRAEARQATIISRFRWVILGFAILSLIIVNISVLLILRTAGMVLRPVEQLVAASRRLAQEDYGYRVEVAQRDEFDELARAYNHMAEQLQVNEERKIETLHQVARAMNHELNNAMEIIELQLQLLDRQSDGNPLLEKRLRQIRASLGRMAGAVESLTRVRRIVLTDYVAGQKMLDLSQSVLAGHEAEIAECGPPVPETTNR